VEVDVNAGLVKALTAEALVNRKIAVLVNFMVLPQKTKITIFL
jgi:hypothetical protein